MPGGPGPKRRKASREAGSRPSVTAPKSSKEVHPHASDGFLLMNVPVLLSDSMPCAGEGKVPVLFGDLSQICIEDCGRDDLLTSTGDQSSPEKSSAAAVEISMAVRSGTLMTNIDGSSGSAMLNSRMLKSVPRRI